MITVWLVYIPIVFCPKIVAHLMRKGQICLVLGFLFTEDNEATVVAILRSEEKLKVVCQNS